MENIEQNRTEQNRTDTPVFYLKINQETDLALKCIQHWIEIVEAYGADYYIVIDNAVLEKELQNIYLGSGKKSLLKTIKSCRDERLKAVSNLGNMAYALLTPFIHAKKYGYKSHFNIDADDTMFLTSTETTIKILKQIALYAENNKIDCFSLDMWRSVCNGKHWSFGIVYCTSFVDHISILNYNIDFIKNLYKVKENDFDPHHNIDGYFHNLSKYGYLNCQTFYIEKIYFMHMLKINTWNNNYLVFNAPYNIGFRATFWNMESKIDTQFPIANDIIKFDMELDENSSSISFKEKFLSFENKYYLSITKQDLTNFNFRSFTQYFTAMFNYCEEYIIFIAGNDSFTTPNMKNHKLNLLKSFGIKTDIEKALRHSWLCVIDSGNVVLEKTDEDSKITSIYCFGNHTAEIMSAGYNFTKQSHKDSSIKIDNIEYGVNKRGLNFVIWDKKDEKVIDSVCFDTWDNKSFTRKDLK
ncbi:MAG: hypothetical protein LBM93_13425 [Oscillospiraceae bacterium]|jgi:hypothetical protein|nr:hypothetical protein [Oscillospiraceae bacterium]